MKAVLVQSNIVWGDPAQNQAKADAVLARHKGADLVVFPEMFSTGFATKPEGIAEEEPCSTLEWMKSRAAEYGCAICGSVALHTGSKYVNRFYFVKPDGEVSIYDKHHLFTYSGEHHTFTAGDEKVIVEWRGWRFRLSVCYDLRFPSWNRNHKDYDAFICVASWPERRRMNWDVLLRARAIENQCYVLGVNRCGDDPALHYSGGTTIIAPAGEYLANCADNCECECEANLDMDSLTKFRAAFPVLDDAD